MVETLTSSQGSNLTIQEYLEANIRKVIVRDAINGRTTIADIELAEIDELQEEFNKALGTKYTNHIISYNCVLDIWKAKNILPEERESFEKYLEKQLVTNLRERHNAFESESSYSFDTAGNAYNMLFPDEPFIAVLERGLKYRESQKSRELIRENSEIQGWHKAMSFLTDKYTPLGSKVVSVSGAGLISETSYALNFVDIYEIVEENSSRQIKVTRYASNLTYSDYAKVINKWDEDYFSDWEGPIDAWFLYNPVCLLPEKDHRPTKQLFKDEFGVPDSVLFEDEFQQIIDECAPYLKIYIQKIVHGGSYQDIAKAFHAVLKRSDIERKRLKQEDLSPEEILYLFCEKKSSLVANINLLARQRVEDVSAGCGRSVSFLKVNDISPMVKFLKNTVAMFAINTPVEVVIYKEGYCRPEDRDENGVNRGGCGEFKSQVGPCGLCRDCEKNFL